MFSEKIDSWFEEKHIGVWEKCISKYYVSRLAFTQALGVKL